MRCVTTTKAIQTLQKIIMTEENSPLDDLLDCLKSIDSPMAGELILHLDKVRHQYSRQEEGKEQEIQEKLIILRRFGTPVLSYVAWAQQNNNQKQQDFLLWFDYVQAIINGTMLPTFPTKILMMVAIDEMVRLYLEGNEIRQDHTAYLQYLNGLKPTA